MLSQRYELKHLNDALASEIRRLMLEELIWSLENEKFYFSQYFSESGKENYLPLLHAALMSGTPDTLQEGLSASGIIEPGSPSNATQTFAWDEFNKYYMRALCRWIQMHPGCEAIVVRGRESANPRSFSDTQVGRRKEVKDFLGILRTNPRINPFGANSGLTLTISNQ